MLPGSDRLQWDICSVEGGGQLLIPERMCLENQGPRKCIFDVSWHVVFRGHLEAQWRVTR